MYELLRMSPEIKRLIVGWATQDDLRRPGPDAGHAYPAATRPSSLVDQDSTTISEVLRGIYTANL